MKKYALIALATMAISQVSYAQTKLQSMMLQNLGTVENLFSTMYAPATWKYQYNNWTIENTVKDASKKVMANEKITIKEYQNILRDIISSTADYHVSIRFYSTEQASLPLTIRSAEGKFFIAYINRDKLSEKAFPYTVGDEVLLFDNIEPQKIVDELKTQMTVSTKETDQALAEMNLTSRKSARGIKVPQGAVILSIKKQNETSAKKVQLTWDYTPELVDYTAIEQKQKTLSRSKIERKEMLSPVADMVNTASENTFGLGSKNSYLPKLGEIVWEADASNSFAAYIFKTAEGKNIGYVRIATYSDKAEKEANEFSEILLEMKDKTEMLVIDQLNNPGGSVFYLYSLVSMLTDTAMTTPRHHMAITPEDIIDANSNLIELANVKNDQDAIDLLGQTVGGYPVTYQFALFMKNYYKFQIDQWKTGKRLTDPYHLYGVDYINPHPAVNYTKPILILVNELDFSGGDFFPTIMQDNKRATILGTRTSGAGGYVLSHSMPNIFGVESIRFTGSIAKRVDNTPIENLGVKPEINYSLTAEDFKTGFIPYKKKILEVIDSMIQ
jgi:C-terminal processing protease CtpA/Prc